MDLTEPKIFKRFLSNYQTRYVPPVNLSNSSRLDSLIRAGKIYLSLQDAVALALENNLDIELSRFGPEIAQVDLMRARAGGLLRGISSQVQQGAQSVQSQVTGGATGGAGGTTGGTGGTVTGGSGGTGGGCTSPAQCSDNDACTNDVCNAGVCSNPAIALSDNDACTLDVCDKTTGVAHLKEQTLFEEDFSDNSAGWVLGAEW